MPELIEASDVYSEICSWPPILGHLMDEELPPNRTQLYHYSQCNLSPEELLRLSDCFVRHPEWRPSPRRTPKWHADGIICFLPGLVSRGVDYHELVAKLDGSVTGMVGRVILEFRVANDPLAADYLADLAVFQMEMELLPGVTHGPFGNHR